MAKMDKVRDRHYPPDRRDNDGFFLRMIEARLKPDMRVLDAGAGAGDAFAYDFRGKVREMVGADLDPRVRENPRLDRGVEADLCQLPFENEYFDMVFSRYVLEHVSDPVAFSNEMARILKPGGYFLFLTPSKWHYVSMIARLTPHAFHDWFNERLRGRGSEDTFPTVYQLNSERDLRRILGRTGLEMEELIWREVSPNYFMWSLPLYHLGRLYEKTVNAVPMLAPLRVNILGSFIKQP